MINCYGVETNNDCNVKCTRQLKVIVISHFSLVRTKGFFYKSVLYSTDLKIGSSHGDIFTAICARQKKKNTHNIYCTKFVNKFK